MTRGHLPEAPAAPRHLRPRSDAAAPGRSGTTRPACRRGVRRSGGSGRGTARLGAWRAWSPEVQPQFLLFVVVVFFCLGGGMFFVFFFKRMGGGCSCPKVMIPPTKPKDTPVFKEKGVPTNARRECFFEGTTVKGG